MPYMASFQINGYWNVFEPKPYVLKIKTDQLSYVYSFFECSMHKNIKYTIGN